MVMGLRTNRTSSRWVSTRVCDSRWRSDFSEWPRRTCTAAPTRTAISFSAGRPRHPWQGQRDDAHHPGQRTTDHRPGDRTVPGAGVTGKGLQCIDELRDGLIADHRLDPVRKAVQRLESHRQVTEDQLRQQKPLRGRRGISRLRADESPRNARATPVTSTSRQNAVM